MITQTEVEEEAEEDHKEYYGEKKAYKHTQNTRKCEGEKKNGRKKDVRTKSEANFSSTKH